MVKRNVENVLAVAAAIEEAAQPDARPEVGFNMGEWAGDGGVWPDQTGHECRTTCCIAGWAFLLGTGRIPVKGDDVERYASKFFGLPQAGNGDLGEDVIFFPTLYYPEINARDIKVPAVVDMLRRFAETGEVEWRF